jgi:hypothetical protein
MDGLVESGEGAQEQELVDLNQQLFKEFFTTERRSADRPFRFTGETTHFYKPPHWVGTTFDVNTIEWNPTVAELNELPEELGKLVDVIGGGTRRTAAFRLVLTNRDIAGLLPRYELEIHPSERTTDNAGIILSDDREAEKIEYHNAKGIGSLIDVPFDKPIHGNPAAENLRAQLSQRKTRVGHLIPATKWAIKCLNSRKVPQASHS